MNIQDFMKDMEKLNEQAEIALDAEQETDTVEKAGAQITASVVDPVIGTACCSLNVPKTFTLPPQTAHTFSSDNTRVIYDVSNLRCCVNQITVSCSPPDCKAAITVPAYEVRLTGCIPYLANLFPIGAQCSDNVPPETGGGAICCSNTFCVNSRIGLFDIGHQSDAIALCSSLSSPTCAQITATLVVTQVVAICPDSNTIKFEITFNSIGNC
ncbi:MAG: hypothetical protein PHD02_05085 [Bacilli bacterium]|nr:hypothetical protein [Bacilli bacterium]